MSCTYQDIAEAKKVPVLLGRGDPYAIVIGRVKWNELLEWVVKTHPDEADRGRLELGGMRQLVTSVHPFALFAVTEAEYPAMLDKLVGECRDVASKGKDEGNPGDLCECGHRRDAHAFWDEHSFATGESLNLCGCTSCACKDWNPV